MGSVLILFLCIGSRISNPAVRNYFDQSYTWKSYWHLENAHACHSWTGNLLVQGFPFHICHCSPTNTKYNQDKHGKKHLSCFFQRLQRDFQFREKLSDFHLTLLLKRLLKMQYCFLLNWPVYTDPYYAYEVNEFSRLLFVSEHSTFVLNAEFMWWAEWGIFQLRVGGVLHSLALRAAQLFLHVTPGYSGWTCAVLLLLKDSACFIPQPACHGTHADYAGTPRMEFFPSL